VIGTVLFNNFGNSSLFSDCFGDSGGEFGGSFRTGSRSFIVIVPFLSISFRNHEERRGGGGTTQEQTKQKKNQKKAELTVLEVAI
jgi:flavodoxin